MRRCLKNFTGKMGERYRKMSIQMVISLSFTTVAVLGMVFIGMSLFLRFSNALGTAVEDNSRRVLTQVNLNLDSYLRRMMRISDTMYYRVIKNTDLDEGSFLDGMNLLYEENRDALVSIAVFDGQGDWSQRSPCPPVRSRPSPRGATGSSWPWDGWRTSIFPPPISRSFLRTRITATNG